MRFELIEPTLLLRGIFGVQCAIPGPKETEEIYLWVAEIPSRIEMIDSRGFARKLEWYA